MRFFPIVFALLVAIPGIFSQVGIKTHQVPLSQHSEKFLQNSTDLHNNNNNLPPNTIFWNGTYYADETTLFIQKIRSQIAPGICFKEVPTASLVQGTDQIPAGNGSDPSLSRIQVCCDGFERNPHIFKQCDPICNECGNGVCVAPNQCVCYPDHVRNLGGYCVATCPIGCANGECQPDGSCLCKPGFILEPKLRKFCIPYCKEGCANGNCTEPETCSCNEGYRVTPENQCVPHCDNCKNGECTAPEICKCNPGYVLKENRCEAVCSKGCTNGYCSAPNTCTCNPGFTLDSSGVNCVAHCDQPCLNGYCGGSNTCVCNAGYILDDHNPNMCIPHCPGGCPNGVCSGPSFCICRPGYVKSGVKGRQVCVPTRK